MISCLIVLGLFFPMVIHGQQSSVIRYNFPVWAGITDLDGTGLYTQLFDIVFGAAGYQAVRNPTGDIPWKKSIRNVVVGKSDTTGAEYSTLIKQRGLIHPNAPLLITQIYIVYRKSVFPNGVSPETVVGKKIVENLGFQLSAVLGFKDVELFQAPNELSAAQMLLRDRVDLILYEEYHYISAKNKYPALHTDPFEASIYAKKPMFLMFADTDQGRKMAQAWDHGLKDLIVNENLYRVTEKYKQYGLQYGTPNFSQYLEE